VAERGDWVEIGRSLPILFLSNCIGFWLEVYEKYLLQAIATSVFSGFVAGL
jgi:hypothetical protein